MHQVTVAQCQWDKEPWFHSLALDSTCILVSPCCHHRLLPACVPSVLFLDGLILINMDCFLTASSNPSIKASCGNHAFWWGPCIFLSLLTLLASLSRDGLDDHWIPMKKTLIFWWREEQINKWWGASTLKVQCNHTEVAKGSLSGERAECTESLGGPLVIGLHPVLRPPLFLSSSVTS